MGDIRIRPSDVAASAAVALSRWSQVGSQIFDAEYNADRLRQVNAGLTHFEQLYQDTNDDIEKMSFEALSEEAPDQSGGSQPSTVQKTFGQATRADVRAYESRRYQQQVDWVTENVTNKRAREELLNHLAAKEVQSQAIVTRLWRVASQREDMASLNRVVAAVLASGAPLETKIARVTERVNQSVDALTLYRDQGDQIIVEATNAAQYSFAANGALAAMKDAMGAVDGNGDLMDPLAAGEAWLAENTKFWDGNPDARAKVLDDTRREFDIWGRQRDNELDGKYSDLLINTDTVEKAELAIQGLLDVDFYDQSMKYDWHQRFLRQRDRLKSLEIQPPDAAAALLAAQKFNEDLMLGDLTIRVRNRELTQDQAFDMVAEAHRNGEVRGSFVSTFNKTFEAESDPYFMAGMQYIDRAVTDENERFAAKTWFRQWHAKNENPSLEAVLLAAKNSVEPPEYKRLDGFFVGFTYELERDDPLRLNRAEQMTTDIIGGSGTAHASLPENRQIYLDYADIMLEVARKNYSWLIPRDPTKSLVYVDWEGKLKGVEREGMAVIMNIDTGRAYVFSVEDNVHILWEQQPDGSWVNMGPHREEGLIPMKPVPRVSQVESGYVARLEAIRDKVPEERLPELEQFLTDIVAERGSGLGTVTGEIEWIDRVSDFLTEFEERRRPSRWEVVPGSERNR